MYIYLLNLATLSNGTTRREIRVGRSGGMRVWKVKSHEALLGNFIQNMIIRWSRSLSKDKSRFRKIIRWLSSDSKCCWVSFSPPEIFTPVPRVTWTSKHPTCGFCPGASNLSPDTTLQRLRGRKPFLRLYCEKQEIEWIFHMVSSGCTLGDIWLQNLYLKHLKQKFVFLTQQDIGDGKLV